MGSPLNVNDLIIHRSDRSGVQELSVTIHKFPANSPSSFTPARAALQGRMVLRRIPASKSLGRLLIRWFKSAGTKRFASGLRSPPSIKKVGRTSKRSVGFAIPVSGVWLFCRRTAIKATHATNERNTCRGGTVPWSLMPPCSACDRWNGVFTPLHALSI